MVDILLYLFGVIISFVTLVSCVMLVEEDILHEKVNPNNFKRNWLPILVISLASWVGVVVTLFTTAVCILTNCIL